MDKQLLLFRSRRFRIYLHWTLILAIIAILVAGGWTNNAERFLWSCLLVVVFVSSILLHELAHAFTAWTLGIEPAEVVLLPIGGVAGVKKFPDNAVKELVVNLAGPVMSLLVALLLNRFLHVQTWRPDLLLPSAAGAGHYLLFAAFMINLWIGLFNFLPSFPTDGGRILRSLLAMRVNYVRATDITDTTGRVVALLLLLAAILMKSILPVLAAGFLIASFPTEKSYALIWSLVKGLTAGQVAAKKFYVLPADKRIDETRDILINNENRYFVLEQDDQPAGAVSRMTLIAALASGQGYKTLSTLADRSVEAVTADQPVPGLLETLAHHPSRVFVVMDEQQKLAGVINFNMLMEYLLLHRTHSRLYPAAKSLALLSAG